MREDNECSKSSKLSMSFNNLQNDGANNVKCILRLLLTDQSYTVQMSILVAMQWLSFSCISWMVSQGSNANIELNYQNPVISLS